MSDSTVEKEKIQEPSFRFNYATVILVLVILIPALYTVFVNLERPQPLPEINPVTGSSINAAPVQNSSDALTDALQTAGTKPDYTSYINLGMAYYSRANYPESIKAWQKALEYNPKGVLAYNNIAAAYGNMNNYEAEIKICEQVLAIDPNLEIAKGNLKWAQSMKDKK